MKTSERIGWLSIILGVLLLALLLMQLYAAAVAEQDIYIEQDHREWILAECEQYFVGPCTMYALPKDAAANIFDAVQPYRRP